MTDISIGRVKWFNNSRGFGFITGTVGGEEKDVFAHHTAIATQSSQFKYLVPGEYVAFNLKTEEGSDKISANNITGVNSGKLLCETRRELRDKYAESKAAREPASESTAEKSEGEWQQAKKRTGGGRGRGRGGRGRGRGKDGKPMPRPEKTEKSEN